MGDFGDACLKLGFVLVPGESFIYHDPNPARSKEAVFPNIDKEFQALVERFKEEYAQRRSNTGDLQTD